MNTRYIFEHNIFPGLYKKDPVKVINKCLTEKTDYIFKLLKKIYDDNQELCPYTLMDIDISTTTKNGFEFIEISMPSDGIEPGNCTKIVLCYSFYLNLFQFYTLEYSFNPKFGPYLVLAAWMEEAHITFGEISDGDNIIDKILTTIEI